MSPERQQELLELFVAMQDGALPESQRQAIEQAFMTDADACRLFYQVQMQSVALAEHFRKQAYSGDSPELRIERKISVGYLLCEAPEGRVPRKRYPTLFCRSLLNSSFDENESTTRTKSALPVTVRWLLAPIGIAVAVSLVMFALLRGPMESLATATGVGSLSSVEEAVWHGVGPKGDVLVRDTVYRLRSGIVRARLTGGGVASLAAPAEFRVTSESSMELFSGRMMASVPDDGSRLDVNSGDVQVVEAANAFGLTAGEDSGVSISVFKGQLTLGSNRREKAWKRQVVAAGHAVSVSKENVPQPAEFVSETYADLWPLAMGIDEAASVIEFIPPGNEESLRDRSSNDKLFLVPEKLNQQLSKTFRVNCVPPGHHWPDDPLESLTIQDKERISSYLLVFKGTDSKYRAPHSISGSISFEQQILGVIVSHPPLQRSDDVFGLASLDYNRFLYRHLEGQVTEEGDLPGDILSVSADGRQLYFNLHVGAGTDHLRVIVRGNR